MNNEFDAIRIGMASPEQILEWSHGEVNNSSRSICWSSFFTASAPIPASKSSSYFSRIS